MANPHRDRPLNRRVEELTDLIHDATNDLNDWLYSNDSHSMTPYINTAERIVAWAAELRSEIRKWSESGRVEVN